LAKDLSTSANMNSSEFLICLRILLFAVTASFCRTLEKYKYSVPPRRNAVKKTTIEKDKKNFRKYPRIF
jgi:hypothetical protein